MMPRVSLLHASDVCLVSRPRGREDEVGQDTTLCFGPVTHEICGHGGITIWGPEEKSEGLAVCHWSPKRTETCSGDVLKYVYRARCSLRENTGGGVVWGRATGTRPLLGELATRPPGGKWRPPKKFVSQKLASIFQGLQ